MNLLPDNFPVETLPPPEEHKLQWFYRRYVEDYNDEYGEGHFILAAYAAIPLFLTPDLLYKIWQNFNSYRWAGDLMSVHRIAVADILLSPLCREIGLELYEMNPEIRLALLEWLHKESHTEIGKERGIRQITDIASLVQRYYESPNVAGNRWGKTYTDAQALEVLSYSDPVEAGERIFEQLRQSHSDTDMLRTIDTLIKTRKRFEKLDLKDAIDFSLFSHQADLMNAWAALLQKDKANFITQLNRRPELLNLLKETSGDGIKIEIAGGLVENLNLLPNPRIKALIIGVGLKDLDNAEHIEEIFRETIPPEQLDMNVMLPSDEELHDADLLKGLQETIAACNEKDHLIVYISSGAYRQQEHTVLQNGIYDEDLALHLNSVNCNSVSLFIEADHSGSAHWLDVSRPGRVVFTSCRFDQRSAEVLTAHKPIINAFTTALQMALKFQKQRENVYHNSNATIFGLFLSLLERYKNFKLIKPEIELWRTAAPQLFAHPNTLQQAFLSHNQNRSQLQFLLRKAGYFHQPSNNQWDKHTAKAFTEYVRAVKPKDANTYGDHLKYLQQQIDNRQSRPIFLLIFSDHNNELTELKAEKTMIMQKLNGRYPAFHLEIISLENPNAEAIRDAFTTPANRNRIRYFYYAGVDTDGNFRLGKEVMDFTEFGRLLDYQPSLKLFVSNTCRSEFFSSYMSQLGIPYSIGISDDVYDNFAAEFAEEFFEALEKGENIEALSKLQSSSNFSENYGSFEA